MLVHTPHQKPVAAAIEDNRDVPLRHNERRYRFQVALKYASRSQKKTLPVIMEVAVKTSPSAASLWSSELTDRLDLIFPTVRWTQPVLYYSAKQTKRHAAINPHEAMSIISHYGQTGQVKKPNRTSSSAMTLAVTCRIGLTTGNDQYQLRHFRYQILRPDAKKKTVLLKGEKTFPPGHSRSFTLRRPVTLPETDPVPSSFSLLTQYSAVLSGPQGTIHYSGRSAIKVHSKPYPDKP